jgi:hypothetical protein
MLRQDNKHALFKNDVTNSYALFFDRFALPHEFVLPAEWAGVMVDEDELDDELVLWGAGRFVEDDRSVRLCAGGGESTLDSFVPKTSVVVCRARATLAPFR